MNKTKITWIVSLVLVSMIAVTGAIVAYTQYDQKQTLIAQTADEKLATELRINESYDRIETNLAQISQYETMIREDMDNAEGTGNLGREERIQNQINLIQQLINENNNLISSLQTQINEKDSRLASYASSVKALNTRVAEYKETVDVLVAEKAALQKNLEETTVARNNLEVKVTNLDTEVAEKAGVIEERNRQLVQKELEMHTAYFTVGTYKSLRDQNIVEKEGGFLGINREKNLANGLNPSKFKEIDTREVTEIPVEAKRIEIITEQDPSSYRLVYENEKVSKIMITDAKKFWGKSKYLVVVVSDSNFDETADSR
jgi:flagellar biosynthesis chaperone FliJ